MDREVVLTAEMVELVVLEVILVKGAMAATGVRQKVATVLVRVMAAKAARLTAVTAYHYWRRRWLSQWREWQ